MKKIILALAFLSSFVFAEEAKELTDEQINTLVKVCESGKDFTNENGTVKYEEACATLGMIYENIPVLGDLGVKQDLAKAFKFYKKACDGGYARGCFGLGGFYFEGKEVTKDDKKALEFFKKACDMGDKESCTLAAVMDGDNANLAKASEQHKKDCDSKGDILACGLFALFMEGKDNKEAAKYYKKACELGKNISDPALQNNPAFNDGIKQFCSRPAELEAQNLRAVQDVIKAKIAEEYRISCGTLGQALETCLRGASLAQSVEHVTLILGL